jgi:RNA polymerase-binding protein
MDRALRGTRMGATSYESDTVRDFAARDRVDYRCAADHLTQVTFAADADIPDVWECRTCSGYAKRHRDAVPPQRGSVRPVRTHFDMLLERRTRDDLEELLAERLQLLRQAGGAATPHTDHRSVPADSGRRRKSA